MKFVIFFSKRTYVFMDAKKLSYLRCYNIIENWSGEVMCVVNMIII